MKEILVEWELRMDCYSAENGWRGWSIGCSSAASRQVKSGGGFSFMTTAINNIKHNIKIYVIMWKGDKVVTIICGGRWSYVGWCNPMYKRVQCRIWHHGRLKWVWRQKYQWWLGWQNGRNHNWRTALSIIMTLSTMARVVAFAAREGWGRGRIKLNYLTTLVTGSASFFMVIWIQTEASLTYFCVCKVRDLVEEDT